MDRDLVRIRFEGKTLQCRPDTTVAVALWENGIRHLSHSPKYGRPRGLTCARGHCTACLMRIDGIPNVRTCELAVREGMVVQRQDSGAVYGPLMQKSLAAGGRLFPVGFYYKWFTRPPFVSRQFLKRIRPLTGVGRLPEAPPAQRALPAAPKITAGEERVTRDWGHHDTVVVGGGLSGLQAALAAPGRVLVLDDHLDPGGQRCAALQAAAAELPGGLDRFPVLAGLHRDLQEAVAGLADAADVEFRPGTKAIAGFAPGSLLVRDGNDLAVVRCRDLVWAAGALDALGLFPGNDSLGVIGPRALYRIVLRDGMDLAGKQVLVIGGGLDFWLSTTLLSARGAHLSLTVTDSGWQSEVSAAVDLKWQLNTGLILNGIKNFGSGKIEATFGPKRSAPGPLISQMRLDADLVVICNRGKPVYDIPYQLGADYLLKPELGGFLPAQASGIALTADLPCGTPLRTVGEAAGALPGESDAFVPKQENS